MYLIVFIIAIVLDRVTKYLVSSGMELYDIVEIIPGFLGLNYVHNTGAAFSILEGKLVFFIIFTVLALVLVVYLWRNSRQEQKLFRFSLVMLASGAIGNLIDRVLYGYVVDFMELWIIPIFNVADMLIVSSVILIIGNLLFSKKPSF